MRICDDRYSRDRLRLDLALRFIRHEARTQTIRRWTGLTDDRIRKLYRSYCERPGAGCASRPRGRSPRQSAFFTRTARMKQEADVLASLCALLGALAPKRAPRDPYPVLETPGAGAPPSDPRVVQALALCEAYETYRVLVPAARISFEHLMCLIAALGRADEIKLAACAACGALIVAERMRLKEPQCASCADAAGEANGHRTGLVSRGCSDRVRRR